MPDLDALIGRLEAASGPDREIDGEIMFTLFAKQVSENGYLWPEDNPSWSFAIRFPGKDRAWFDKVRSKDQETIIVWRDGDPILMNSQRVPELTKSLDAAMSLLPDGRCRIAVGVAYPEKNEGPVYWANCGKDVLDDKGSWIAANESEGATPAIALLIAILKARKAVA